MAAACVVAVASPAFAKGSSGGSGKTGGGGGTSASLTLVNVTAPGTAPAHGQTITFNVTSSASQPYVQVDCFQNGAHVYSNQAGFYAGYPWSQDFILSSSYWTSGAASCTAVLEYNTAKSTVKQATLAFNVTA